MNYEMLLEMGYTQMQIQNARNQVGENLDFVLEYLINVPSELQSQQFAKPMLTNAQQQSDMPQIARQSSQAEQPMERQYSQIRIKKTQSVQQPQVQQNQGIWQQESANKQQQQQLPPKQQQFPLQQPQIIPEQHLQNQQQKSQIPEQKSSIPPQQQQIPVQKEQIPQFQQPIKPINQRVPEQSQPKSQIFQRKQSDIREVRIPGIPVGITYEQASIEPYDPLIVNLILRFEQEEDEDQLEFDDFRLQLQKIILQLLISKERMVPSQILIASFERARKYKMQEITFQYILKRLDYYFKLEIQLQQVKFQNQMLQKQFCGSGGAGRFFEVLEADAQEGYIHNSIWKQHQKLPIQQLPPNFNIVIKRADIQRYGFPKLLEINFSKLKEFITYQEHKNYQELEQKIEDIKLILAHYQDQPFVLEDVFTLLNNELQEIKNEILQYPKADDDRQLFPEQKIIKLHLQAIINKQKEVYTYNFTEEQWYKYTNSIVIPMKEEDVLFDGFYNAIQVTYVDEQQKNLVLDYEKQRQEIANRVHVFQSYESLQDIQLIHGMRNTIYNQLIQ